MTSPEVPAGAGEALTRALLEELNQANEQKIALRIKVFELQRALQEATDTLAALSLSNETQDRAAPGA